MGARVLVSRDNEKQVSITQIQSEDYKMSNEKKLHPFVEVHVIQSFAVSCLNRDEGNAPKWATFGGVRRARVSSQSWKYAMRHHPLFAETTKQVISMRTQFLVRELHERLTNKNGKYNCKANETDEVVPAFVGKYSGATKRDKSDNETLTKVLLFLSKEEIDEMADALHNQWDVLLADTRKAAEEKAKKDKAKRGKSAKAPADEAIGTEPEETEGEATEDETSESAKSELDKLASKFQKKFSGRVSAVDIALFGRMLAEGNAAKKVEAACQVAHPLSTHRTEPQDDFFTAMDDLKRDDDVGGGAMIGNLDFTTPCYYRYARLDWEGLKENLEPRQDMMRQTAEAFLATFIKSIPSARKNSMPSFTMPSFVMAVVRTRGESWQLINAFEKPVEPINNSGIIIPSIQRLDHEWNLVKTGYDEEESTVSQVVYMLKTQEPIDLPNIGKDAQDTDDKKGEENINNLVKRVVDALESVAKG
jgi:CRISPR system Cascade subunit CasC